MKKTLATIGLFLFPLTAFFCLMAFVMLSLGNEGSEFRSDAAMWAASIYRAVLLISIVGFVGFVGSVVVLIRGRK
jgi:hypothetical protein